MQETKAARDLKKGERFSWKGSFGTYTALSDAEPCKQISTKVVLEAERDRRLTVRLNADQEVEIGE